MKCIGWVLPLTVLGAVAAGIGGQVVAPPIFATQNASLSVLTNNVYMLTELLNWGQKTRAGLIARSVYVKGMDVVVLEECWANRPCKIIRNGLRDLYPYQTPTLGNEKKAWNSTTGAYSPFRPMNGGVVIMSKWPIKQQHQFIYKKSCGIDSWGNKGFVYVVLDYLGTNIHVFGTHMQNDDKRCREGQGAQIRAGNLDDMRAYIDARNIPAKELVIIAGDFNINDDSVEYSASLLGRLNVQSADEYVGYGHSFDPLENSIAGRNFPGKQGMSVDFVFVDKAHNQSVRSLVQTLLKVHSADYRLKGRVFDDFSDHFPVKAVIELDLAAEKEPLSGNITLVSGNVTSVSGNVTSVSGNITSVA